MTCKPVLTVSLGFSNYACIVVSRDVVLSETVWERMQNKSMLKQLSSHFNTKRENDVGPQFLRLHAPLHLWW